MKNLTMEECEELEYAFQRKLADQAGEIRAVAAIGSAVFDKLTDIDFESVFNRADACMYMDKQRMKEQGENSSVNI